ncbi:MAG TPA: Crp/Fnr family transcriptional regulator [Candidatus Baltobacteraceae bacterium]|nr:Crp/Fnr family transcriptional regulator [Candidatus Baltobacteraceae bacterium]
MWFPETGAVSRMVQLPGGDTVETGIVGNDGVVGLPLALGVPNGVGHCCVHIGGEALVISAADFRDHVRSERSPLFDALLSYTNLFILTLAQLTACHCLHRIDQRLCRCLLMLDDHARGNQLRLTHDTLAEFLGVHRPSITYAVQALVSEGAIASERRRIIISDRAALLRHVCECYAIIRSTTKREISRLAAELNGLGMNA